MICKDDFYKFLRGYKENYKSTADYFLKHPQSEKQKIRSEYEQLINDSGYRIVRGSTNHPSMVNLYERDDLDYRESITYGKVADREDLFSVIKSNRTNDDSDFMSPTNPLYEKFVKFHMSDMTNYSMEFEPHHTITVADITLSLYEINEAFEEYSEEVRLKKHAIYDLYVPYHNSTYGFMISNRYSEEFCDLVEHIASEIMPYFKGLKKPPADAQRYTWYDLATKDLTEFTVLDAACIICTTVPEGLSKDIPKLQKIVENLYRLENHGASILIFRGLTNQRVSVSFSEVPLFKDIVENLSIIMREIRSIM